MLTPLKSVGSNGLWAVVGGGRRLPCAGVDHSGRVDSGRRAEEGSTVASPGDEVGTTESMTIPELLELVLNLESGNNRPLVTGVFVWREYANVAVAVVQGNQRKIHYE